MKVRFLGVLKPYTINSGCSTCGNRVSTAQGLTREVSKTYVLPDGSLHTFRLGVEEEVPEEIGLFLIDQTYVVKGVTYQAFEVL